MTSLVIYGVYGSLVFSVSCKQFSFVRIRNYSLPVDVSHIKLTTLICMCTAIFHSVLFSLLSTILLIKKKLAEVCSVHKTSFPITESP